MIISTIDSLSVNNPLTAIIQQVSKIELSDLPDGISEIDGQDIFVNRIRSEAKAVEDSMLELHEEYIDVHLILSGSETIGFTLEQASQNYMQQHKFENDCEFSPYVENEQFITLNKNQYCVFYPKEWHRPMVKNHEHSNTVNKVVIKIRESIL
ncbi:YhcH/YjgK/YiaL family protein [Vibrio sp. SA48]|uniref:YhcH/YjgK/YiaL family protein n=1 Tax=Vibrio sp. S12_S33 TaxID=2720223 RepID=UPI0017807D95|nr:YhcH/YjgK/YiaL family protein [Vibrio sp. S12_S33]MBD1565954.1 DUF386 domain-containing protein [Vibrio sp. S12_S33]